MGCAASTRHNDRDQGGRPHLVAAKSKVQAWLDKIDDAWSHADTTDLLHDGLDTPSCRSGAGGERRSPRKHRWSPGKGAAAHSPPIRARRAPCTPRTPCTPRRKFDPFFSKRSAAALDASDGAATPRARFRRAPRSPGDRADSYRLMVAFAGDAPHPAGPLRHSFEPRDALGRRATEGTFGGRRHKWGRGTRCDTAELLPPPNDFLPGPPLAQSRELHIERTPNVSAALLSTRHALPGGCTGPTSLGSTSGPLSTESRTRWGPRRHRWKAPGEAGGGRAGGGPAPVPEDAPAPELWGEWKQPWQQDSL